MNLTVLDLAGRFTGMKEIAGERDNPQIVAMIQLVRMEMAGEGMEVLGTIPADDETPWCSAFIGYVAFLLNLPRPAKSSGAAVRRMALRARSWLTIGDPIDLSEARPGYDCVVLNRDNGPVDPTIINAPGHVGLYVGRAGDMVALRGGNQGNMVSDRTYPTASILGVRRWWSGT